MAKRLRQVSFDFITDSEMPDDKVHALVTSAIRGSLLKIIKARIGIVEVKHTLTDKGPIYIPITELEKEKDNGSENAV